MKTYLVLDLETIDDPEFPPPPPKDGKERRGPPPPPHCQIVCAGYAWVSHEPRPAARLAGTPEWTIAFEALYDLPERKILREVSSCLSEVDPLLVTYGGHNFDGPVLAARSFRRGVPLPWYYDAPSLRRSARYRFSSQRHLDLCDELADFGFRKAGLQSWALLCGMPGKLDVDGGKVGEMVAAGRINDVAAYCLGDVAMTVATMLRRMLLVGELPLDGYRGGVVALLSAMAVEPRLSSFVPFVKRDMLLLSGVEAQDAADDAVLEDPAGDEHAPDGEEAAE